MFNKFNKIIIPGLLALLLLPLMNDYYHSMMQREYYRLLPLLLMVIGILFYFRWRDAPAAEDRPPRWAVWGLLLIAVVGISPLSFLYYTPYLNVIALVIVLGALALVLSSYRKIPNLFGIWCLFLLFIRAPHQIDLRMMTWLENTSAAAASAVMDYYGILHVVHASMVALPAKEFVLADICHGPVSWVSTLGTAAVVCVLRDRRLIHSLAMMLGSFVITWLLSVLKITVIIAVFIWFKVDLMEGGWMWGMAAASFVLSLALVLSMDALCLFFLKPTIGERAGGGVIPSRRKLTRYDRVWNAISEFTVSSVLARFRTSQPVSFRLSRPGLKVAAMMLMVSLISLEAVVVYYKHFTGKVSSSMLMHTKDELIFLNENSVHFQRPGWKLVNYKEERRDFDSIWGMYSKIWTLKLNDTIVTLALDFPYHEWHDVKACYRNLGWKAYDEQVLSDPPLFSWGVSQTKMRLPSGDYGFILCSHCDQIGDTVEPKPADHQINMIRYRLSPKKWTAPFGESLDKDRRTFYQTQAMVTTPRELDEATMQEIRTMYADFREQVRQNLIRRSRQIKEAM